MPLDGFTLHFLTGELRRDIVGCRVEKVHQPSKDELVMHLRDRNGAKKLFLSASANSPRVHLTTRAPENPAVPPMFCMLMRKHLTSAQITDVRQNGLDRVLAIDFSATNELGDRVALTLYAEIMAKHSNLILVSESGRIVDAVKRIDCTQSSVRQILPAANIIIRLRRISSLCSTRRRKGRRRPCSHFLQSCSRPRCSLASRARRRSYAAR